MVLSRGSLSFDAAVEATAQVVAELRTEERAAALAHVQALAQTTHGRCVLGLAGFVELANDDMAAFFKRGATCTPDEEADMIELLLVLAEVLLDEDNSTFAARLGVHMLLMRLMEHESEAIQEAAAQVVGNCTSSAAGITFPFRARPLEPPKRLWPLQIKLPLDPRDGDSKSTDTAREASVLIRQVPIRMTGQPKTGYLLWGAAFVLARWIHLHRELFVGKNVLEVGSGLGLGGITAARYAQKTTLTDYQGDTCSALEYNVQLNRPFTHEFEPSKPDTTVHHLDWDDIESVQGVGDGEKMDIVIGCDIICEPSTAEGFLRVIKSRLSDTGVAYLMNADSHSRFGVTHLHALLADSAELISSITPVHNLPDGVKLLETVADARELSYEFYEIRLRK